MSEDLTYYIFARDANLPKQELNYKPNYYNHQVASDWSILPTWKGLKYNFKLTVLQTSLYYMCYIILCYYVLTEIKPVHFVLIFLFKIASKIDEAGPETQTDMGRYAFFLVYIDLRHGFRFLKSSNYQQLFEKYFGLTFCCENSPNCYHY